MPRKPNSAKKQTKKTGARKRLNKNIRTRKKSKISKKRKKQIINNVKVGFAFFFSVLFLASYFMIRNFNAPFASASGATAFDTTNRDIYTLLVAEVNSVQSDPVFVESLSLYFINKTENTLTEYKIPVNLVVDLPGKYGEEEIKKVIAIGELSNNNEHLSTGVTLLNDTVKKIFGITIDKYIVTNNLVASDLEAFVSSPTINKLVSYENFKILSNASVTNMTLKDFYSFVTFASGLREDKIKSLNYKLEWYTDLELVDSAVVEHTFGTDIATENISVAILNGTTENGLANTYSRYVTNRGIRVISTGNSAEKTETSYIVTKDLESKTLKYLARLYSIKDIRLLDETTNSDFHSRADITIVLGFDIIGEL